MLAQGMSEDPNSSQNGGDLGSVPESALEKANADLRRTLMALGPGEYRSAAHRRGLSHSETDHARARRAAGKLPETPKCSRRFASNWVPSKDQLLKAAYYRDGAQRRQSRKLLRGLRTVGASGKK